MVILGQAPNRKNYYLLNLIRRGGEPFAIEGIPVAGHLRTIGVLDDDAIDWKEDFCGFTDRKIAAEGSIGDIFYLRRAVPFFNANGLFSRLSHKPMIELSLRNDLKLWIL
jgi:hypothetical protein